MNTVISAAPNLAGPNLAGPNLAGPIDADLAHLSEIGPVDVPQTTTVAGYVISLTIESWAAFGRSVVGMAQEMLDGLAVEFKRVLGLTFDDYHLSYVHLGDPVAFV
ncbi:MAG TPA: hypothetical protein VIJ23_17575 [Mycobacterium sp.]